MVKFTFAPAALLLSLAAAHPEDHEMHEALEARDAHAAVIQRGLSACLNNPKYVALQERAQQRRWEKAQHMRKARGIDPSVPYRAKLRRRDLAALEADEKVEHNKTSLGYTTSTSSSTLFASYKNVSCILTPEVTYGPYYVTGEYFRTNVTDGQEGVPVHLEYQYIDVDTCEPATGLYLETWSANATGVYSGIEASGNGNSADATNLNTTFLRGITEVNSDGVGTFDTIFAGHYEGRATHIHIMTHINGTKYSNGTFQSSNVAHVGQLFFDTDLKDAVEATYPYNTNTQAVTTNDGDMWAPDEADNNYDPFPDYAYLGNDISDGLLMWISIGINKSASYTVEPAGMLTAEGGTSSSGSSVGGDSGSSSSNNTMGSAPSGSGAVSGSGAPTGSVVPTGSGSPGSMGGSAPSGGFGGPGSTSSSAAVSTSAVVPSSTRVSSSSSTKASSTGKSSAAAVSSSITKKSWSSSAKQAATSSSKHSSSVATVHPSSSAAPAKSSSVKSSSSSAAKKPSASSSPAGKKSTSSSAAKKATSVPAKKHSTTSVKKHSSTTTAKKHTTTAAGKKAQDKKNSSNFHTSTSKKHQ